MSSKLDFLKASPTEELLTENEFLELLDKERRPRTYIGFEISGQVHLGTGIVSMAKVRDFLKAGFDCTIFLADWHSWLNGKLGGDLGIIREVAGGYFKTALKIGLSCVGADPDQVRFKMGSDVYDQEYWTTLMNVCKGLTVKRVQRMITIMGRREGETLNFAQLVYPPMQIADIFNLNVHVAHGGMDQRKAHVGAREVAEKIGRSKPLALHHHLLLGLTGSPQPLTSGTADPMDLKVELKMSKSKPGSAIFIHDSVEAIQSKVLHAYCPERATELNAVIDLAEFVILPLRQKMRIERSLQHGGSLELTSVNELKRLYSSAEIHPLDLKRAVADSLADILKPARSYFEAHQDMTAIFQSLPEMK